MFIIDEYGVVVLIICGLVLGLPIGLLWLDLYIRAMVFSRIKNKRLGVLRIHHASGQITKYIVDEDKRMVELKKLGKWFELPKNVEGLSRERGVTVYDFLETDPDPSKWVQINTDAQVKEPRDPDFISQALQLIIASLTADFYNKKAQMIQWLMYIIILLGIISIGLGYLNYTSAGEAKQIAIETWKLCNVTR